MEKSLKKFDITEPREHLHQGDLRHHEHESGLSFWITINIKHYFTLTCLINIIKNDHYLTLLAHAGLLR